MQVAGFAALGIISVHFKTLGDLQRGSIPYTMKALLLSALAFGVALADDACFQYNVDLQVKISLTFMKNESKIQCVICRVQT